VELVLRQVTAQIRVTAATGDAAALVDGIVEGVTEWITTKS
jgi:hypothetical protein